MRCKLLISLILIIFFPFSGYCNAVLKINTSIKPPFSTEDERGFFDLLLKELFKRVDLGVELVRLPAERALQMADEGYSDGEVPRIAGLGKRYPNLIEIGEPVIHYNFVAFTHDGLDMNGCSWEKLSGKEVGYIIGWKIYEKNVPHTATIVRVSQPSQLIELIHGRRIDVGLYERYAGWHLIRANGYTNIVECSKPLAVRPMHLYLHRRHLEIADRVALALKEMKKDGSWQYIFSNTLGQ